MLCYVMLCYVMLCYVMFHLIRAMCYVVLLHIIPHFLFLFYRMYTKNKVNVLLTECTQAMDLTFVIDSSGSICGDVPDITTCDNWDALRNFTHAIVDDMIIGPNNFMVAMIEFESSAWIRWNLTK